MLSQSITSICVAAINFVCTLQITINIKININISSRNKKKSLIFLSQFDFISAPTIFIVDEQGIPLLDKYYEVDSTIQLTCIVRHISMMSSVVFWIHNNNSILNYDVTRGGIRLVPNSFFACLFMCECRLMEGI